MIKKLTTAILALFSISVMASAEVINVKPPKGDATQVLNAALRKASKAKGPVEIRLAPGTYNLSKEKSLVRYYRVSNTASETEHKTADKHIGLLLKNLKHVTINGDGKATLLTHGEMTPWVIDSCTDIRLTGLTVDAADPSVPEMTVIERTDNSILAKVNERSRYEIRDGKLYWKGFGWEFTDGIAQLFSPAKGTNLRCNSPVALAVKVEEVTPGTLRFSYSGNAPACAPGETFQMRHAIRSEVAGLVNRSTDVTLSGIRFKFMGNFGVVSQLSKKITIEKITCWADSATNRTAVGFADFFQVSSCGGLVRFDNCRFGSAHDDPINIHGTHLKITEINGNKLTARYMHHQTFGFLGFTEGDTVSVTDPATLLPVGYFVVGSARMTDERNTEITMEGFRPVEGAKVPASLKGMIVENRTWCPTVSITNSYFSLIPTRGILVTTWRPVVIRDNRFVKCPMAAILIADDGRSWFESGAVENVTISGNVFEQCSNPVISIAPENVLSDAGYVHRNITVTDNTFISDRPVRIGVRSVDGFTFSGNRARTISGTPQELLFDISSSANVTLGQNR